MKRFAGYDIIEELAAGNHGTFYLARPPAKLGLEQEVVAIKVLDRHASDNEFKRMAAELQVLLELGHPRLVPILDAGHDEGRLYYATIYYSDGGLPVGPGVDARLVAALVADAAEAAHALHDRGVAHRDIKPTNILIADGRGHLADLGVANYLDAQFTATGFRPVGTLTYSDPRLIHGDFPGRASDVWSLGATLHMALTGCSLIGDIPNTHLAQAIEYVLEAKPIVSSECPPTLAAIIARSAQPERADRYPTAEEMAAELRAFAGLPLTDPGQAGTSTTTATRGFPVEAGRVPVPDLAAYAYPLQIVGLRSTAGHFNHPNAVSCRITGEPRDGSASWISERRARPPLGILVDDRGLGIVVQWEMVIGRQPDADPAVTGGRAQGVAHADQLTMSRVHLRVQIDGWAVTVTDESSNGTRIRSVASDETRTLPPGQAVVLEHGDLLLVEGRSYRYHSSFSASLDRVTSTGG